MIGRKLSVNGFFVCLESCDGGDVTFYWQFSVQYRVNNANVWKLSQMISRCNWCRERKKSIFRVLIYAINLQYSGSACSWIILGSCNRSWNECERDLIYVSIVHQIASHACNNRPLFPFALFTIVVIAYHHLSKLIFYLHIMCTLHFQSVTCFCELHSIKKTKFQFLY